ncbi:MAG: ABC transporter permease [Verrucomicrobia bacterium]|nr:ABC transporter permease [Verrucomicrobiota bacterium]
MAAISQTSKRVGWFEFQATLPRWARMTLGAAAWVIFLGVWQFAPRSPELEALLPTPLTVVETLYNLFAEKGFATDVWQSLQRTMLSFALAIAVAMPIGVLMGSFPAVEAFLNPIVSPFRYLPAPSFIPLLLAWFGTGNEQKIALLFIGVVWFLISLLMDDTKRVPIDFIDTSRTLGAKHWQVVLRVILPCALPFFIDTMRQMLAVSWTYLVIAEIVAATDGIGAVMMRARRLVRMDIIMAGILTIGMLGFLSDAAIRGLRWWAFPYLRSRK